MTKKRVEVAGTRLVEFTTNRQFTTTFDILSASEPKDYQVVLGRSRLRALQLNVRFEDSTFEWGDISMPMRKTGHWTET